MLTGWLCCLSTPCGVVQVQCFCSSAAAAAASAACPACVVLCAVCEPPQVYPACAGNVGTRTHSVALCVLFCVSWLWLEISYSHCCVRCCWGVVYSCPKRVGPTTSLARLALYIFSTCNRRPVGSGLVPNGAGGRHEGCKAALLRYLVHACLLLLLGS